MIQVVTAPWRYMPLDGEVQVVIFILRNHQRQISGLVHCPAVFDTFLCWPPTPVGEFATQHCPPVRLSDTSRLAFRVCGESGLWLGRRPNVSSPIGWTNYTPCFPQEVNSLFDKVSEESAQMTYTVARFTRYLEILGLSVSFVALLASLFIFYNYRALQNDRTRIHRCLFGALLLQISIRLVLYIDQAYVRSFQDNASLLENATVRGIDNMPYLCETAYILLEFAITMTFSWMLVEGYYLNHHISKGLHQDRKSHIIYYTIGWVLPFFLTMAWAMVGSSHYRLESATQCWYGYNFLPTYWILQGPRLAVVVINLLFLLNIMKVLIPKLERSASEMEKIKKAVRAALFLLPLLGITNVLDMIQAPLESSGWQFAVWSFTTHFLRSFQGFFIALLYCFLNGEVQTAIKKHFDNMKAMRETRRRNEILFRSIDPRTPSPTGSTLYQLELQMEPLPRRVSRRRLYLTASDKAAARARSASPRAVRAPATLPMRSARRGLDHRHSTVVQIETDCRTQELREFYRREGPGADPPTSFSTRRDEESSI